MKKVTVIHFVHTLFGGVANVASNLILHQKEMGWKTVVVYVNYDPSFPVITGEDTVLLQTEMKNIPGLSMSFGMNVKEIYDSYTSEHPDENVVCHVHNIQALGAFGNWGRVPLICTLHSLNGKDGGIRKKISNYLYVIALKRLLKNKKPVTSVSQAIIDEYAKIPRAGDITVIHNGTIIDKEKRSKQEKFTIGHVGNLSYAKGWDTIFDGFCLIPEDIRKNMLLKAAGNEEDFTFQGIMEKAEENGVENQVECLGYVANAKEDFISTLDLLILASRNEGLGLVQAEAMGYGTPVLGRDTGGICEILKDRYNGFVIETPEDVAEKIQLLYKDKELYHTLSENALTTYSQGFTSEVMCSKYDEKYMKIL